ncbi:MAG: hypothetical protein A2W31_16905 [Planctomycetes bacterium RBG_16_64_10]|nr:MAG: hypothetical protein A2W31_16905 [Planctomycetes bacterium RBG_16_64_10]
MRSDDIVLRPLLSHPSFGLILKYSSSWIGTRLSRCVADDRRIDVDDIHAVMLQQRTSRFSLEAAAPAAE